MPAARRAPSRPTSPWKRVLSVARALLGLGLLALVLSSVEDWSAARSLLATPLLLLGVVLLPVLGAAVEARRLCILFRSQGFSLSFPISCRLVVVGAFFNNFVPGGTGGDVMKLYYLAADNRGRTVETAMVLLVDRAVALFALLFLVIALVPWNLDLVREHAVVRWLVWASLGGMAAMLVMAALAFSPGLARSRLRAWIVARLPLGRFVDRALESLHAFRGAKRALLGAALWSLMGHLLLALMYVALGSVLVPGAPAVAVPLLALLGMLANALPVTPGGLGVGEAAFERLFGLIGQAGGAQLILVWRLGTLPIAVAGGLLFAAGRRARPGSSRSMESVG